MVVDLKETPYKQVHSSLHMQKRPVNSYQMYYSRTRDIGITLCFAMFSVEQLIEQPHRCLGMSVSMCVFTVYMGKC